MNTFSIKDICKIGSSKRIFASEYTKKGIPFFRSTEVIELANKKTFVPDFYISENKYNEIAQKFPVPQNSDILIAAIGANMGTVYLVNLNYKFYFKDGNVIWLREFENTVNPKYLYYWLTTQKGYKELCNTAIGSAQRALTIDKIGNIKFKVPNINVQQHIIDIIGSLDDKIESNNKIIEKCYIFLNLNMKKLLIEKDKKIISSLDDIEIISSGIDKFNSDKIYLDTSCVSDNSIVDISNKVTYTDRPSRANMKPIKNSVWFAKLKSSPKHIIVKDYSDEILDNCIFSTGFLGIKIDNEKFNLLSTYFTSDVFEKEKDSLSIGATMQSINNVTFKGMYIPDFSPTDYISFNNLSEPILKLIYKTELENIKLRKLKNIYLAKFF